MAKAGNYLPHYDVHKNLDQITHRSGDAGAVPPQFKITKDWDFTKNYTDFSAAFSVENFPPIKCCDMFNKTEGQ